MWVLFKITPRANIAVIHLPPTPAATPLSHDIVEDRATSPTTTHVPSDPIPSYPLSGHPHSKTPSSTPPTQIPSAYEITNPPAWFNDSIVNTSLFLLSHILSCPEHGIWICDPQTAGILYKSSRNKEESVGTDVLDAMTGKDFYIIPICDGLLHEHERWIQRDKDEERLKKLLDEADSPAARAVFLRDCPDMNPNRNLVDEKQGSHWTLLVIDLRNHERLRVRRFDSLCSAGSSSAHANKAVAKDILSGVKRVLAVHDGLGRWQDSAAGSVDKNTPNQMADNACKHDGGGACGPFVWAMAKELAQYIIDAKCESPAAYSNIKIELPEQFKDMWNWDSMATRRTIRGLVDRERRIRRHLNKGEDEWFVWRAA
ncbi:hypothetical protein DE146DRAFT_661730 [Phaeosphaeria sp. MPI-PUGE-AT-0046c]|nr:hypothetical protein DE146DRAFT_661730 [Phaeosphaeria sp. MPI-PUGE-AT-0046c]